MVACRRTLWTERLVREISNPVIMLLFTLTIALFLEQSMFIVSLFTLTIALLAQSMFIVLLFTLTIALFLEQSMFIVLLFALTIALLAQSMLTVTRNLIDPARAVRRRHDMIVSTLNHRRLQ